MMAALLLVIWAAVAAALVEIGFRCHKSVLVVIGGCMALAIAAVADFQL